MNQKESVFQSPILLSQKWRFSAKGLKIRVLNAKKVHMTLCWTAPTPRVSSIIWTTPYAHNLLIWFEIIHSQKHKTIVFILRWNIVYRVCSWSCFLPVPLRLQVKKILLSAVVAESFCIIGPKFTFGKFEILKVLSPEIVRTVANV